MHPAAATASTRSTPNTAVRRVIDRPCVRGSSEQVGRRACVLGRRTALACRERGREPLVVRLDRHADDGAQSLDERVGLESLCTALAAQRHRHPDDDAIGLVLEDEVAHLRQSVSLAARSTTPSGRAIVPVASETATPVRAEP